MIIQKHLSEKHNFIFNMKGKVVILDVLVVTGFCSRGLFNLKITEPSPDLGWGKTWSCFNLGAVFVISYIFLILNSGV